MRNLHLGALFVNFAFFGAAAAASCYLVYQSWFYGFFLTPFPTIITFLMLCFAGAAAAALVAMFKGPAALQTPEVQLNWRTEKWIRCAAVTLPLPLFCYAAMSYASQHADATKISNYCLNKSFVRTERFIFGTKRADDRYGDLINRCTSKHQFALAERFAYKAVRNLHHVPFTFNSASYKERLVNRVEQLAVIYEAQGKYQEAMGTWDEAHRAAHEVLKGGRLNTECRMIRSHVMHDAHMLMPGKHSDSDGCNVVARNCAD